MKRKIILLVSLATGVLAALLTRLYIAAGEAEVKAQKDALVKRYGTMEVLCFAKDVPGGTALAKGDLGLKTVPALGMRGQALTEESVSDIVGRRTMIGHRRGDVLFWSDVEGGNPAARGLAGDVKRTMRAMSVNCTGAASVSGMVRPGDRVDVIGTYDFPAKDGTSRKGDLVTCTLLQNVLVLAIGQQTAKSGFATRTPAAGGFATVTLEVTPREAEMLAFTEQMRGRIVLTLRGRNDSSYEKELPQVDFDRIRGEIEQLNLERQQKSGGR